MSDIKPLHYEPPSQRGGCAGGSAVLLLATAGVLAVLVFVVGAFAAYQIQQNVIEEVQAEVERMRVEAGEAEAELEGVRTELEANGERLQVVTRALEQAEEDVGNARDEVQALETQLQDAIAMIEELDADNVRLADDLSRQSIAASRSADYASQLEQRMRDNDEEIGKLKDLVGQIGDRANELLEERQIAAIRTSEELIASKVCEKTNRKKDAACERKIRGILRSDDRLVWLDGNRNTDRLSFEQEVARCLAAGERINTAVAWENPLELPDIVAGSGRQATVVVERAAWLGRDGQFAWLGRKFYFSLCEAPNL
jgi:archaellum component FlaC